jgi:hypothetical protein
MEGKKQKEKYKETVRKKWRKKKTRIPFVFSLLRYNFAYCSRAINKLLI